jgi:ribulose-5-phosphate 4-epimerase/fuculose-1-phosphate aldolase
MLETLREEVWRLHLELPRNDLVRWTSGNVSARDPESGYVVIKPSGVRYDDLKPEQMVVVDLEEWKDRSADPHEVEDLAIAVEALLHGQEKGAIAEHVAQRVTAQAVVAPEEDLCLRIEVR